MSPGILADLQIPIDWTWSRLWHAAPRVQETGRPNAAPLSVFLVEGVVPRASRSDNRNALGEDLGKYQVVRPGDLVFNKLRTWQGGLGASTHHGIVSPAYYVCRPGKEWDSRFIHYLLISAPYLAELKRISKFMPPSQFDIPWDSLRVLALLHPPRPEQRRIADYLDAELLQIDRLIMTHRRMSSVLQLKRQRVVEEALGLTSTSTIPLKFAVGAVGVGIVITPARWYVDSGGVAALRGLNVRPGKIDTTDLVQISQEGHAENIRSRLREGDVVIVRTGQAGTAAAVPRELDGCNCIDLLTVKPGSHVDSSFLVHFLNSATAGAQVAENSVGSLQAHFNVGSMKSLRFPRLSRIEQERRAAQVDVAVRDIDDLESQIQLQISLLTERRQALVTAAVTGQIDVSTASGVAV